MPLFESFVFVLLLCLCVCVVAGVLGLFVWELLLVLCVCLLLCFCLVFVISVLVVLALRWHRGFLILWFGVFGWGVIVILLCLLLNQKIFRDLLPVL